MGEIRDKYFSLEFEREKLIIMGEGGPKAKLQEQSLLHVQMRKPLLRKRERTQLLDCEFVLDMREYSCVSLSLSFFFFFFCPLGPHPRPMEVPRLGV